MADLDKIVEDLSSLSVIDAAELVKKLEEKWDVRAAAPAAAVAVAAAARWTRCSCPLDTRIVNTQKMHINTQVL